MFGGCVQPRAAIAVLICKRYGIDVTPVVALLAVGRPAVAEEARGIAISAMAEILHARDAGARESRGDVAGKVEERVVRCPASPATRPPAPRTTPNE